MPQTERATWGFRLAPRRWPSLFRAVRETPDDVAVGAEVFFALGGHDEGPAYRRFMRDPLGQQLVQEKIQYPELFMDLEQLRKLPDDTLGREYARQLDERDIDPKKLAALTEPCYEGIDFSPDHAYVRDRVRHAHDVIHTLTDAGVDLVGEVAVAGFTFGQTGNKGWAMLVLLNVLTGLLVGRIDGAVLAFKGYVRGRRARLIPAAHDWERLLRLPIEDARTELGITPFERYRPLYLDDVFANAPKAASRP